MFRKYMHIEKYSKDTICNGLYYIFPKIDGTNGSIWVEDTGLRKVNDEIVYSFRAGSRNRELTLNNDNFDFYNKMSNNSDNYIEFFINYPNIILYGEYLVPHTLKNYKDDSWGKFYVFDFFNTKKNEYVNYEEYHKILNAYNIEYIPAICKIKDPQLEYLLRIVNNNTYLTKPDSIGEGIVLKNYDFKNKYGNQNWIKIIRDDFKYMNAKEFKTKTINQTLKIEEKIINRYVNDMSVGKVYERLCQINSDRRYVIQNLLIDVYKELIVDNIYNIIKENNFPVIDFKLLNKLCILKIKIIKSDVF